MQLKVPASFRPQVHSGVALGMVTVVFWQGLLKNVPKRLCNHSPSYIRASHIRVHAQTSWRTRAA